MKFFRNLFRYYMFHEVLQPLITENVRQRREREIPDEWFWADRLAIEWGYLMEIDYTYKKLDLPKH